MLWSALGVKEIDVVVVFDRKEDLNRFSKGYRRILTGVDATLTNEEKNGLENKVTLTAGENYKIYRILKSGATVSATIKLLKVKRMSLEIE